MDKFRARTLEIVSALTEEEKLHMLSTHHRASSRLGEFYIGTEVARGYVGREPERVSTVFPQPVGLAATFDRGLLEKLGRVAGLEARAYYNRDKKAGLCLWGPTVDMVRDPRWGRTEEAYGEDVCLTGELSAAYTRGMADPDREDGYYMTVPTLKHFCANNNEEDRVNCDAYLPLRLRHEYYYAAFENAIRNGGARSVMAAYNELNSLPAIMDPELQTVLKDQWGLWFVVSDGGDFSQSVTAHKYCPSMSEAYELSLKAGCDAMTDMEDLVTAAAREALEQGRVTWEDIDRALCNMVYARVRLGQGDESCPFDSIGDEVIDCPEHRRINRRAALEQTVLLKNNGLLPLKSCPGDIAVVGPLCDSCLMDWYTGYSSYSITAAEGVRRAFPDRRIVTDRLWDIVSVRSSDGRYLTAWEDGSVTVSADGDPESRLFELQDWGEGWVNLFSVKFGRYIRLFDDGSVRLHRDRIYDWFTRETFNLKDYCGKTVIEEFLFHGRLAFREDGELSISPQRHVSEDVLFCIETVSTGRDRARALAKSSAQVVYCTGNHPVQVAKECYDRRTLRLNIQPGMTELLAEENPDTVLSLISSYPYSIVGESRAAGAVLWSSHAGPELGSALGETLSGKSCPGGRLPLTWYKSEFDLPDIMDYDIENAGSTYMYFKGEPLYPFGFGLSYASFEYSSLTVVQTPEGCEAAVDIKNTSDRDGDEVPQVYFTAESSALSRPLKKLCGFERVHIRAGETVTVRMKIPRHILEVFDPRSRQWLLESGPYRFFAGSSSADERLAVRISLSGSEVPPRPDRFWADSFESARGVRLSFDRGTGRDAVTVTGWGGEVVYRGLDLSRKREIRFRASTLFGGKTLTVKAGETELSAELMPSDTAGDFKEYTLALPEGAQGSELRFGLQQDCRLLDIELR